MQRSSLKMHPQISDLNISIGLLQDKFFELSEMLSQKAQKQAKQISDKEYQTEIKIKRLLQDSNFQLQNEDFFKEQYLGFQPIYDTRIIEDISNRLIHITPNYIPEEDLKCYFQKELKIQQQNIKKKRKEIQKRFPYRFVDFGHQWCLQFENNTLKQTDLQTLKSNRDLNDQIMNMFLHIIKTKIIDDRIQRKSYFFNTFFMLKLVGRDLENIHYVQYISNSITTQFRKEVQKNYNYVMKWTKKYDIFEKDYLIIPVNIPRHWNLIIVVHPNSLVGNSTKKPCILHCDSFKMKNNSLIQAIRIYLKKQLIDKKNYPKYQNIDINEKNLPGYQLLLPRQTNYHDCGLYLLAYVEQFLLNPDHLQKDFSEIMDRWNIRLIPRSFIFSMRSRIYKILVGLSNPKASSIQQLVQQYLKQRIMLKNESQPEDFDDINPDSFKIYLASQNICDTSLDDEQLFTFILKYYMKPNCNYYEFDDKKVRSQRMKRE